MKLIIDIPEDMYNDANILIVKDFPELKKAIINGAPYEDRPQGYWIKNCDSCDCSNCYDSGARFTRKDCSGRCSNCGELQCCTDNFCPNCGADMRGDT